MDQLLKEHVYSRVFTYRSLDVCDFTTTDQRANDKNENEEDENEEQDEEDDGDDYWDTDSRYPLSDILLRRGHSAVSLDDQSKILVFGGYSGDRHCNELFIVDIDAKTVERKVENKNSDRDARNAGIMMGRSFHPMVLISENKFLVTGGYCNYTDDGCPNLRDTWIIEFSLDSDFKFTKLNQSGDVPPPMESHSLVYYNGYCITYGGSSYFDQDDLGIKHRDVYALNVESGVWTRLRVKHQNDGGDGESGGDGSGRGVGKIPTALTGHSCHIIEGTNKMILYGGYDPQNSTHNELWMLHIVLPDETKFFNEYSYWEEIIPVKKTFQPEPTLYHRSLLLNNRSLVVHGGALDWESQSHTNQLAVFDLESREWTNLQNDECLLIDKDDPNQSGLKRVYGHTLTFLPKSGRFVVLGGSSNDSTYYKGFSQIVEILSPYNSSSQL